MRALPLIAGFAAGLSLTVATAVVAVRVFRRPTARVVGGLVSVGVNVALDRLSNG